MQAVGKADWLRTVAVPPIQESVAAWRLGIGETAVIACALQHGNPVTVLDDREGRRCAASHGLAVVGTIGVVLLAKDDGLIPLVAPCSMSWPQPACAFQTSSSRVPFTLLENQA